MSDAECAAFIQTKEFTKQFKAILNNDREIFDIPEGWNQKSINESPLISGFDSIWNQIKDTYNKELSALAFTEIPSEKDVAEKFKTLIKMIRI